MVTVVNKPPHRSVVKEIVCENCGCTLEYVPRDIKKRVEVDYVGDRDVYHYIECPECGDHPIVTP